MDDDSCWLFALVVLSLTIQSQLSYTYAYVSVSPSRHQRHYPRKQAFGSHRYWRRSQKQATAAAAGTWRILFDNILLSRNYPFLTLSAIRYGLEGSLGNEYDMVKDCCLVLSSLYDNGNVNDNGNPPNCTSVTELRLVNVAFNPLAGCKCTRSTCLRTEEIRQCIHTLNLQQCPMSTAVLFWKEERKEIPSCISCSLADTASGPSPSWCTIAPARRLFLPCKLYIALKTTILRAILDNPENMYNYFHQHFHNVQQRRERL